MPDTTYTIVVPESDTLPDVDGLFDYLEGASILYLIMHVLSVNRDAAMEWCRVISNRFNIPRPTLFSILLNCVE